MDKQTLSNYGWLVIVTLILAVMLALATPFGTYVGDAVVSVANGFVGTANSATDEDNIAINQSKWEDKLNANPLVHKGTISANAVYVTGIKCLDGADCNACGNLGWCLCDTTTYTAGNDFPQTTNRYDVYVYGDYVYMYGTYNAYYGYSYAGCPFTMNINGVGKIIGFYNNTNYDGWCVGINNTLGEGNTRTSFGTILESINNKPITNMSETFTDCTKLENAPKIPSTVNNLYRTFSGCSSLKTSQKLPSNIIELDETFNGCSSLIIAPEIPQTVQSMWHTFRDCTSLKEEPKISNNVTTDKEIIFMGCTQFGY